MKTRRTRNHKPTDTQPDFLGMSPAQFRRVQNMRFDEVTFVRAVIHVNERASTSASIEQVMKIPLHEFQITTRSAALSFWLRYRSLYGIVDRYEDQFRKLDIIRPDEEQTSVRLSGEFISRFAVLPLDSRLKINPDDVLYPLTETRTEPVIQ